MNADPSISAPCPALGEATGSSSDAGTATHLFTRTTADGVTMRVYRLAATGIGCGPIPVAGGPATPSLSCGNSQQVAIEMSDATAVGQGDLGWSVASASPTDSSSSAGAAVSTGSEPQTISTGAFGVVEGDPVWWVAFQVGAEVTRSEVTFADGSTDEMAPVDGVAVLAHHVTVGATSDPDTVTGTVELFDGSGSVVSTITLPQQPVPPPTPVPAPLPAPLPVPSPSSGTNEPGTGVSSGSSGGGQAGSGTTTSTVANTSAPAPLVGSAPDDAVLACPMVPAAGLPSTPTPLESPSKSR